VRGQKAAQSKSVAFTLGEGGTLVEKRITQKGNASNLVSSR
jgi:hypothetical protein